MTNKEKIRNIIELFIAWNGETEPIDVANIDSAVDFISDSLQEKPVSKDLKAELDKYIKEHFTIDTEQLDRFGIDEKDYMYSMDKSDILALVEHFTKWQKEQMMKDVVNAKIGSRVEGIIYNVDFNIDSNLEPNDKVKVIIIKSE